MKIQELRIGNYILDNYNNVVQVELIDNNGGINGYFGIAGYEPADIKSFKPIPLTEDWLLKFRFKKKSKGFYIKNEIRGIAKWSYQIEMFPAQSHLGYCAIYEHGEGITVRNFQYVNQLQNLYFSLTGEELTII